LTPYQATEVRLRRSFAVEEDARMAESPGARGPLFAGGLFAILAKVTADAGYPSDLKR